MPALATLSNSCRYCSEVHAFDLTSGSRCVLGDLNFPAAVGDGPLLDDPGDGDSLDRKYDLISVGVLRVLGVRGIVAGCELEVVVMQSKRSAKLT